MSQPTRRGTTNGNARGSSEDRRQRREWLVETFRADMDVVEHDLGPYIISTPAGVMVSGVKPACRCYRCGKLLTVDTVTVDRIIPGCKGGTYRRTNIRPACGLCNSETGGSVRSK